MRTKKKPDRPLDATEIIEAFGGYAALAARIGLCRTAVFNWFRSGIPKGRCLELAALARKLRLDQPSSDQNGVRRPAITLETLMLSQPRPPGS